MNLTQISCRVEPDTKKAFKLLCLKEGTTVQDKLSLFIESNLDKIPNVKVVEDHEFAISDSRKKVSGGKNLSRTKSRNRRSG